MATKRTLAQTNIHTDCPSKKPNKGDYDRKPLSEISNIRQPQALTHGRFVIQRGHVVSNPQIETFATISTLTANYANSRSGSQDMCVNVISNDDTYNPEFEDEAHDTQPLDAAEDSSVGGGGGGARNNASMLDNVCILHDELTNAPLETYLSSSSETNIRTFSMASMNHLMCTELLYEKNSLPCDRLCLDQLPDEILFLIFAFVKGTWAELRNFRFVCRRWYEVMHRNIDLLRTFCLPAFSVSEEFQIMLASEKTFMLNISDYFGQNRHREINPDMRGILIDWLVEVCEEFTFQSETLFLSVAYVDRYLSTTTITRGKLQLLGVVAILIAAKFEEINPPTVADLVYITDNTYTKEEILGMEINVLNAFRFDLCVKTTQHFLQCYLHNAQIKINWADCPVTMETVTTFANYLAEMSLLEYRFTPQRPSMVAAAIMYSVFHLLALAPWECIVQGECFYYPQAQVQECYDAILATYRSSHSNSHLHVQALNTKYNIPQPPTPNPYGPNAESPLPAHMSLVMQQASRTVTPASATVATLPPPYIHAHASRLPSLPTDTFGAVHAM